MNLSASFAVLVALIPYVLAQSPEWGQCGGTGWTGATTCVSGTVCTVMNPYYSQCLAGTVSSRTAYVQPSECIILTDYPGHICTVRS